jgi:cation:H+ antiporter
MAVNSTRRGQAWKAEAPGSHRGRKRKSEPHPTQPHPLAGRSTGFVLGVFAVASIVTLAAGYTLEEGGNALAGRMGMTSGIFGATVLALVTALPGISTGFAAIKLRDYALSVSEIFGGNAFAPALFILGDVIAGTPVLVHAKAADLWMGALGVIVTSIFVVSFILRPQRTFLRIGVDSWLAIAVYAVGIVGLATIPK